MIKVNNSLESYPVAPKGTIRLLHHIEYYTKRYRSCTHCALQVVWLEVCSMLEQQYAGPDKRSKLKSQLCLEVPAYIDIQVCWYVQIECMALHGPLCYLCVVYLIA